MAKSPVSNFLFKFIERIAGQFISIIVTVILARLLDVEVFGSIEIILVVVSLCQIFVQSGLNTALIQKKDCTEEDFSLTFYLNVTVSIILYCLIFALSPIIESFYGINELSTYLRFSALVLVPCSITSIQNAYLAKQLQFEKQMICSVLGTLLGGCIGVVLAYRGFGIWSFIAYQLGVYTLTPIISFIYVRWYPKKVHDYKRLKPIISFGLKIFSANILETIYNDVSGLIIGKVFSPVALALYGKGKQFPQALITSINGSIQAVAFPYMAKKQDSIDDIKDMLRRLIKISSFVVFPVVLGMLAASKPFVVVLLTNKWIDCTLYMQLMCIIFLSWPIMTANSWALNAIGRSDLYLRIEIYKKILNALALLVSIVAFRSVTAVLLGQIIVMPVNVYLNARLNKVMLKYKKAELLVDIMPSLLASFIMCVTLLSLQLFIENMYVLLGVQIALGFVVYFFINLIISNKALTYSLQMIKDMFNI